jgi:hypothetical protein
MLEGELSKRCVDTDVSDKVSRDQLKTAQLSLEKASKVPGTDLPNADTDQVGQEYSPERFLVDFLRYDFENNTCWNGVLPISDDSLSLSPVTQLSTLKPLAKVHGCDTIDGFEQVNYGRGETQSVRSLDAILQEVSSRVILPFIFFQ